MPLQLVNAAGDVVNVSRIDISWHRNAVGEAGDQPASNPREGSSLPSASVWNGAGNLPAVLRAELAGAPKSNVSVASLVSNGCGRDVTSINQWLNQRSDYEL